MNRARVLGLMMLGLNLGTLGAGVTFFVLFVLHPGIEWLTPMYFISHGTSLASLLAMALIASLIIIKQPRNAFGWLFGVGTLLMSLQFFGEFYKRLGKSRGCPLSRCDTYFPAQLQVEWLSEWIWVFGAGLTGTVLFLLFPTGRLISRRWIPVAALSILVLVLGTMRLAFGPGPLGGQPFLKNPYAIDALLFLQYSLAIFGRPLEFYWVFLILSFALGAAALITRFVREQGERRQQVKWVAASATLVALAYVAMAASFYLGWGIGNILNVAGSVAFLGLTAGTAIAIFKYRLWDIDIVLKRAILFGALSMFITMVYVLLVFGAGTIVPGKDSSLLLPLVASVAAAIGFQPVRERGERLANRVVYGERAVPYELLTSMARQMESAVSLEEVGPLTAEAAGRAVGAVEADFVIFLADGEVRSFPWRSSSPHLASSKLERASIPVEHEGTKVGRIDIAKRAGDPVGAKDTKVVEALATQTALALKGFTLNEDLRKKALELERVGEELDRSRTRLARADQEARAALERSARSRVEPLIEVTESLLDEASRELSSGGDASPLISEAGVAARRSLEAVREVARGLVPPLLTDKGVVSALDAEFQRGDRPVSLVTDGHFTEVRLPPEVETAVYACCLGSVQAAASHGGGDLVVTLKLTDSNLDFEISSREGVFDPSTFMQSDAFEEMSDRVEALGGRLEIRMGPARQASIVGQIPLQA